MDTLFTPQEKSLLVTVLQERQRELLLEISRTELHDFRRELQDRELLLESLLNKLGAESQRQAA